MGTEMSRSVKSFHGNKINFTIDHILNVAGESQKEKSGLSFRLEAREENGQFEWLTCTRYKPPRLPRQRKKDAIRQRKLGRNPRIPFSGPQIAFLEAQFLRSPYLSSSEVARLATHLELTETRVKIWFQNRRAREKRENADRCEGKEAKKTTIPFSTSPDTTTLHPPGRRCTNTIDSEIYLNSGDFPGVNRARGKIPFELDTSQSKTAPLDLTLKASESSAFPCYK